MPTSSNNNSSSNNSSSSEPFGSKMKRVTTTCMQSTGLCCFKFSKNTNIQVLEARISSRKKKFGIDYINSVQKEAPEAHLKKCLRDALGDIEELQEEIEDNFDRIDDKTKEVKESIRVSASGNSNSNSNNKSNNNKSNRKNSSGPETTPEPSAMAARPNNGTVKKTGSKRNNKPSSSSSTRDSSKNSPKSPLNLKKSSTTTTTAPPRRGSSKNSNSGLGDGGGGGGLGAKTPEHYRDADPSKWNTREYKFSGQSTYSEKGKEEHVKGNLSKGIQKFKSNPDKLTALAFQSDMKDWPVDQQQYMLVHRMGTEGWKPVGVSPTGWMTVLVNEYERLLPFKDNVLPKKFRDKYTDGMTFQGKKLHSSKNLPIMPGRGMGCGDNPGLKIIGDVDPSDIFQGSVGDCWLLSGISAVAEFDGAIKRLFRKTSHLDKMPWDGKSGSSATGNTYTITLWDLPTWTEVDIVIDERLPAHYSGKGDLLAGKPSEDGELWACYLEKALAIHSGGWDKIVGGQCTHAWALLTGCK